MHQTKITIGYDENEAQRYLDIKLCKLELTHDSPGLPKKIWRWLPSYVNNSVVLTEMGGSGPLTSRYRIDALGQPVHFIDFEHNIKVQISLRPVSDSVSL